MPDDRVVMGPAKLTTFSAPPTASVPMLVCDRCRAVVWEPDKAAHTNWHTALDEALDVVARNASRLSRMGLLG